MTVARDLLALLLLWIAVSVLGGCAWWGIAHRYKTKTPRSPR